MFKKKIRERIGAVLGKYDLQVDDIKLIDDLAEVYTPAHVLANGMTDQQPVSGAPEYENLFKSIRDAILVADTNRRIMQYNPAFSEMFGYAQGEITGRVTSLIYRDETRYGEMGEKIRENIANPDFVISISYKRKNGDVFTGETKVFYLRDTNGKVTAFVAMIRDVTEREEAQKKLRHSHDLMKYIIEHTNSAVAVHDLDLNYIFVSQRYLEEYKVTEPNIIGRNHYEVFPDLPQKWRDVHQRALRGEVLGADRDPYHRDNGTTEWTRWECRPWYDDNGEIGGIIVYTEVITSIVESEEKLRDYNDKLELAEQNAGLASYEYNLETGSLWWSNNMYHLLGFENTGRVPEMQDVLSHFHPDDRAIVGDRAQKLFRGEDSPPVEYRSNPETGPMKYFVATSNRISNNEGKTIRIAGSIQDVTRQKTAELELRKLKQNLEKQVEEKTHELTERVKELERFHDATIDREFRMRELRQELEELKKRIG